MKTKKLIAKPSKLSEIKKVPVKTSINSQVEQLCYNCESNKISPHEVALCDFCADKIRWRPTIN